MTKKKNDLGEEKDFRLVHFLNCPRCGSNKVKTISKKKNGVCSVKTIHCESCDLRVTNQDIWYLKYIWNSPRALIIDHCFRDLDRAPWTAYANNDVVNIWGGKDKLKNYVEQLTGYEIVIRDAKNLGKGIILDRIG